METCTACNGAVEFVSGSVGRCQDCGGVQGQCLRGDVSKHVKLHLPMMRDSSDLRFFDLLVLGSKAERVLGWMDSRTRRVVQFG